MYVTYALLLKIGPNPPRRVWIFRLTEFSVESQSRSQLGMHIQEWKTITMADSSIRRTCKYCAKQELESDQFGLPSGSVSHVNFATLSNVLIFRGNAISTYGMAWIVSPTMIVLFRQVWRVRREFPRSTEQRCALKIQILNGSASRLLTGLLMKRHFRSSFWSLYYIFLCFSKNDIFSSLWTQSSNFASIIALS